MRAPALLPQIAPPRTDHAASRFVEGPWLIAWGLFKKVVVADNLAPIVNAVFAPASLAVRASTC